KRRVMQPALVDAVARHTDVGAELMWLTDVESLHRWSLDVMQPFSGAGAPFRCTLEGHVRRRPRRGGEGYGEREDEDDDESVEAFASGGDGGGGGGGEATSIDAIMPAQ